METTVSQKKVEELKQLLENWYEVLPSLATPDLWMLQGALQQELILRAIETYMEDSENVEEGE